jgi:hypothetical protein
MPHHAPGPTIASGAYVFISNLIPLYVLMMIAIKRYHR